ncbi:MAG: hypothetical protein F4Z02_02225 [Acidimicrobiia bacterium]|nr:hypothetical protein [Acidimicrobiia bacterium]MYG72484.1 hypothetical protein [Acidimicrobiia bacterium]
MPPRSPGRPGPTHRPATPRPPSTPAPAPPTAPASSPAAPNHQNARKEHHATSYTPRGSTPVFVNGSSATSTELPP